MTKYKYDGKEYDLDLVIANSKKGLDLYIQTHKVNDSKFKDAVLDLLDQMRAGNSTEASNRTMYFKTKFGETKPEGLFRDRYKNNRHYNQGVAYILGTLSGMSPYEEPKPEEKPKTKLSAAILGKDITARLGDTSTLNDEYKRKAESDAWNYVLNKYKWDQPDLYEVEGPHTLSELKGFLDSGIGALGTTNTDDDNFYYSRFGITSPFYKAPTEAPVSPLDTIKLRVLSLGLTEDLWNQLLPLVQEKALKDLGIDTSAVVAKRPEQKTTTEQEVTNNGVISFNRENAGHIFRSGGLSDSNQLNDFKRTYMNLIVPQLKDGTWTTGRVKHSNGVTYDTRDLLGAMVNHSLLFPNNGSLVLKKIHRKGQKGGDLYIIPKSYNPETETAVYYNKRTANFSIGKADLDFIQWAARPENASYLKEGGVLKMQNGGTTGDPEVDYAFSIIDEDSLDRAMSPVVSRSEVTTALDKLKKETKETTTRQEVLNTLRSLSLGSGLVSMAPIPGFSYGASVLSSGTGILANFLDPELTLRGKIGNSLPELLGFVPGGVYVRGFNRLGKLGKYVKNSDEFVEAENAMRKVKTKRPQVEEALDKANKAYDVEAADKNAQALNDLADLELDVLGTKVDRAYVPWRYRALPNVAIATTANWVGTGKNPIETVGDALKGDHESQEALRSIAIGTLAGGASRGKVPYSKILSKKSALKSITEDIDKITATAAKPAATGAATAAAAAASANDKKLGLQTLRQPLVAADKILINPSLGNNSPSLTRGKNTSDEVWRKIASVQRPSSGNGIYVYDKNNRRLVLSAKDAKTYTLSTEDGKLLKEFPVSDKSTTNSLFASKNGWYGATTSQFDAMPYLRNNGQFKKRGGKINNLKSLRNGD